ncbi:MAG: MtnX-like HAD-IB family phosphatase [Candidatus Zixiibacteriota bacterium]|nr:MAG: MtnX-like HAD-IB family phosphatase [candidate division Zixibacteria bacterium]
MTGKNLIVFCDFDGTFTQKDVGHGMSRSFSEGEIIGLITRWKQGEITSRDCLREEAAMVRITEAEFYAFLDNCQLRQGAREFYDAVKSEGIPFYILSDGADLYINYILRRNNLTAIPYFSNRGTIRDNRFIIEFPYENDGCVRCGCCKGSRIREITGSERSQYKVVFIGDGLSDICALPEADIVFARGDLLAFCRSNRITALEYETFFDILDCLRKSGEFSG